MTAAPAPHSFRVTHRRVLAIAAPMTLAGVPAGFLLTSTGGRFHDETNVVCERGSLRWSATDGAWLTRDGGTETALAPSGGPEVAFAGQLADFAAACREHRPPGVDGDYGRSVVATVLAIYASAASGRPEPVAAASAAPGRPEPVGGGSKPAAAVRNAP